MIASVHEKHLTVTWLDTAALGLIDGHFDSQAFSDGCVVHRQGDQARRSKHRLSLLPSLASFTEQGARPQTACPHRP